MSVDVAIPAVRRRDRTRRWSTGVVVVAAVVGAVAVVRSDPADPGDPAARRVSRNLEEGLVPYLGVAPFAGTADLRAVTRPSDEVRAWFTSERAVYRVVDARRDEATLVVWQRARDRSRDVHGEPHRGRTRLREVAPGRHHGPVRGAGLPRPPRSAA